MDKTTRMSKMTHSLLTELNKRPQGIIEIRDKLGVCKKELMHCASTLVVLGYATRGLRDGKWGTNLYRITSPGRVVLHRINRELEKQEKV